MTSITSLVSCGPQQSVDIKQRMFSASRQKSCAMRQKPRAIPQKPRASASPLLARVSDNLANA
ncbi:MAG: hypothetical protein K9J06_00295 [Flavobacteriales bacterium]|nr:hypothetical protein [Flavobacteriales bacterium]